MFPRTRPSLAELRALGAMTDREIADRLAHPGISARIKIMLRTEQSLRETAAARAAHNV